MRRTVSILGFILVLGLLLSSAHAQYILEKYKDTGPDGQRLVIVVTGDGYTTSQQNQFRTDAANLIDALLFYNPWYTYEYAINVYLVGAISNQSGADHNPYGAYKDTYFDATYWTGGIERLLTVDDYKVFDYISYYVPDYDYVFVLVNDTKYGGSGGALSVTSMNSYANRILLHEVGHSYANLADEYETGGPTTYTGPEPPNPNVTIQTNATLIKWKALIDPTTPIPTTPPQNYQTQTGLFQGAMYSLLGIYRSALYCCMRDIIYGFCPVCQEEHALRIHDYCPLDDGVQPAPGSRVTIDQLTPFDVSGGPFYYMQYQWRIDGQTVGATCHLDLLPQDVPYPRILDVTATDRSPLLVNYPWPNESFSWTLMPQSVIGVPVLPMAKWQNTGDCVNVSGCVSAIFSDCFYVQSPYQRSGLKAMPIMRYPVLRQPVSVTGALDNNGPELALTHAVWEGGPIGPGVKPTGMSARALGGSDAGLQNGVKDGVGVNTLGLLVKIWGTVTFSGSGFFYVDDGCGVEDGSGFIGVKVYGTVPVPPGVPAQGKCVTVTGISSAEGTAPNRVRIIRADGTGCSVTLP